MAKTIHGGEKAVKQLQHGEPLTGLAAESEAAVRVELASDEGVAGIAERNAIRLQAVADLYYQALQRACDLQQLQLFDSYSQRFAWLSAAAMRAWVAARDLQEKSTRPNVIDMLKGGEK